MQLTKLAVQVLSAIGAAERFLVARQSQDGLWRDYSALEPGWSEAWVTAVVGWSLTLSPAGACTGPPVSAAAESIHALAKGDGWGYNRNTASDADSTAWVWRFLARIDDYRGRSAILDLCHYLSPDGTAHTFHGARYGAWAGAHADVTPVLGLALLAVQAGSEFTGRVRKAALSQRTPDGLWHSYWWTSNAYAVARNLEFLAATGGIPEAIKRRIRYWLKAEETGVSPFVIAQELAAAACVDKESGIFRCEALLDMQASDGGWAASRTLLVPAQHAKQLESATVLIFADEERLMSTAMAMAALKFWLTR